MIKEKLITCLLTNNSNYNSCLLPQIKMVRKDELEEYTKEIGTFGQHSSSTTILLYQNYPIVLELLNRNF